ncbi:Expansin-like B1 [Linum perenne]
MALSSILVNLLAAVLLMQNLQTNAATCKDCFVQSRAAHYPNSDEQGTDHGACGFGTFGATLNGGDVSAASELYRNGLGCGACYQVHCSLKVLTITRFQQVRCTNSNYCSDKGVNIVITDQGSSANTDFILSRRAFAGMAQTKDAAAWILAHGIVDIEYRRHPNQNITIKIDENSNNPYYLGFVIRYQQGEKDITAVQLCEVLCKCHYYLAFECLSIHYLGFLLMSTMHHSQVNAT